MSGPKISHWELERRRREELRREREAKRQKQIAEISGRLDIIANRMRQLEDEHGKYARKSVQRVREWSEDVKKALSGDIREAWRSLKGIEKYLDKQSNRLKEKARKAAERQAIHEQKIAQRNAQIVEAMQKIEIQRKELDRIREECEGLADPILSRPSIWIEEALKEVEKNPKKAINSLNGIAKYLESHTEDIEQLGKQLERSKKIETLKNDILAIREDYHEIMNPGIEQRIEHFAKALEVNPENERTLEQIRQFRHQLAEIMEEYEQKKAEFDYIKSVFSDALGGDFSGDNNTATLSGEIDGVPLTVTLHTQSGRIDLDTPTDGSCKKGLDALISRLDSAQIHLGPIRVLNTGETINAHVRQDLHENQRLKS